MKIEDKENLKPEEKVGQLALGKGCCAHWSGGSKSTTYKRMA